ncbi:CUB and EGF-like domain-containing protein 1 [Durusdinium trenchii]|uniref:CUB and EGF-like domain-containing protein 1 n=1 Tax=Durusdinium trenchii TaxID=1381693 RepID=A0ABP0PF32_9DINO
MVSIPGDDGSLGRFEFVAACEALLSDAPGCASVSDLHELFDILDPQCTGHVSLEEFSRLLEAYRQVPKAVDGHSAAVRLLEEQRGWSDGSSSCRCRDLSATLDPWVSRRSDEGVVRTVVILLGIDLILCLLLCRIFTEHAPLAQLGMPEGSGWICILSILTLRMGSQIFGTVAACRRSNKLLRRYYNVFMLNLLLSVVILRPLLLCECFCFEPSMDLVMTPRASRREAEQCDVWSSFEEASSRRLKAVEWPNCAQRELSLVPDLFKVAKNVSLQSAKRSCVILPFPRPLATLLLEMEPEVWDWASAPLLDLHPELMSCFKLRRCGALHLRCEAGEEGTASGTGTASCGNLTACKLHHPVMPHSQPVDTEPAALASCPPNGWEVSFLKDLEKYECFRFRIGAAHGPATELCRLVVRAAVTLLVVAALLALPCAIVIRKFLENNCGDFIDTEEQFDVGTFYDSRYSMSDSFVPGAGASYFRATKTRSFSTGNNVELASVGRASPPWPPQVRGRAKRAKPL